MLVKTRAIVLKTVKYAEAGLVVKAYTEHSGLKSLMVHGVRKNKAKNAMVLFQGLNLVEMIFNEKDESQTLVPLKECTLFYHFEHTPYDIYKSSIAQFVNELIYKSIREEEGNPGLFGFLVDHIIALDKMQHSPSNFHLAFMLEFSKFLGFYPYGEYNAETPYFLLHEGIFAGNTGISGDFLSFPWSEFVSELCKLGCANAHELHLAAYQRHELLDSLLLYYRIHLPGMGELNSPGVLKQLFHH